ncbi:HisA/HisF family protein [Archaeoglobus veneficus]|uniref:HisA/hisF family protein n=1 Tax=Archaeoglobus veneficus (strain DSM 11195 / SNP6) TaxID=693661 RepID=F2KQ14_ARCVS|nr:HisA/HisF family protein [Archaeoglobus veneficus]AEA47617.1 hisA/hisF family protein [Archaeoglobus veneficus SNP6]
MKVYFVMDILNGEVVRAVRGERQNYRPVHLTSRVVTSSDPLEVVSTLNPKRVYVADLDAIMGRGSNVNTITSMIPLCEELIADCGFRSVEDTVDLPFTPVLGSETFDLRKIEDGFYVSLDVRDGLMDASNSFNNVEEAVEWLNSFRLKGVIVLSIGNVGTLFPNFRLVEKVVGLSTNPVLAGGGIRSVEDIERAEKMGCDGVLIATAVHEGLIPPDVLR